MGGCCCCSSKGVGVNHSPAFYHVRKDTSSHIICCLASIGMSVASVLFRTTACAANYRGMGFTVSWVRFVIEVFVSSVWTLFDVHSIVQYPRASEEREPLSSHHGTVAALSTGLLVNTNLETSSPDTYRPPPAPLPYDVNLGRPQTPPSYQETCGNKNDAPVHTANTGTVDETISGNDILETLDELLKKSDYKVEKDTELASSMEIEVELEKSGELKKSSEPLVFVGEECPTCLEGLLEGNGDVSDFSSHLSKQILAVVQKLVDITSCFFAEYDDDNPKIITKCEHHFHLACILEWMERSDTCPVCDQVRRFIDFGLEYFNSVIDLLASRNDIHSPCRCLAICYSSMEVLASPRLKF
ncbi:hypothetical protein RHGRI_005888 [Rhododendron griersonianum]|uniref:RING-type E3 ubiquitin transferase n=1 Tax=Rhododendron griersonianum TaxID=479676 RepID=A0AAV6LGU7_9ERIC|nr:hypothetical protein RHGRI_005888 [Rhododendron griersonianum]